MFFAVIHCGKEYDTILTGPRLHFSGGFVCDPATVNNNIENFDIKSFVPHHALSSSEGGKGLYSPRGTNSFLLTNVVVRSVCYSNQACTGNKENDDVIGRKIKGRTTVIVGPVVKIWAFAQLIQATHFKY